MKANLIEMEGFLRGKCLPGDMLVNETNAEYLVRKFAEAEAKCAALAAENAALKDGVTYFAYSPEYGFDYFANKQAAIDTAQEEIDAYREDADDGWSEDVQRVSWGIVMQQAQGFDAQGIHTSDNQHTYQTCDYRLVDAVQTPATDAFLAEVRAQGVEMLLSSLPPHYTARSDIEKFAAQLRQDANTAELVAAGIITRIEG